MSAHGQATSTEQDKADGGQLGFGFLLRRHRQGAGLTQEELASRSGLSVRTIRDLERGRAKSPHRESVRVLITALGLVGTEAAEFRQASRAGQGTRSGQTHFGTSALCELPSGVADFTGRSAELARLRIWAAEVGPVQERPAGTVVISAILGVVLHCRRPRHADRVRAVRHAGQMAGASSSKATATRSWTGWSTASS
jgi:transcriptional regulator with XRE-family HTH domain